MSSGNAAMRFFLSPSELIGKDGLGVSRLRGPLQGAVDGPGSHIAGVKAKHDAKGKNRVDEGSGIPHQVISGAGDLAWDVRIITCDVKTIGFRTRIPQQLFEIRLE